MNTYSVFLPLGWQTASTTSAAATRLAQTLSYLFYLQGLRQQQKGSMPMNNSWTQQSVDLQTIGASNALAPVKGVELVFCVNGLLPSSLDDGSVDRSGVLYGTPSNTNGAVPRMVRTTTDDQDTVRPTNKLQPYPMAGDMVLVVSPVALLESSSRQVELLPISVNGQGVFIFEMNADSADGVYANPLSDALGYGVIGGPRRVASVGTDLIAINPVNTRTTAVRTLAASTK